MEYVEKNYWSKKFVTGNRVVFEDGHMAQISRTIDSGNHGWLMLLDDGTALKIPLRTGIGQKTDMEVAFDNELNINRALPVHANILKGTPTKVCLEGTADWIDGMAMEQLQVLDPTVNFRAAEYFRDVGTALHALHNVQICHYDAKSENVMLRGTEHVLVDFGRAKMGLDQEQLVEGRKEDIAFLCTWTSAWMDPENKEVVEIMEKLRIDQNSPDADTLSNALPNALTSINKHIKKRNALIKLKDSLNELEEYGEFPVAQVVDLFSRADDLAAEIFGNAPSDGGEVLERAESATPTASAIFASRDDLDELEKQYKFNLELLDNMNLFVHMTKAEKLEALYWTNGSAVKASHLLMRKLQTGRPLAEEEEYWY